MSEKTERNEIGSNINPRIAQALAAGSLKLTAAQEAEKIQKEAQADVAAGRGGTSFMKAFGPR